MKKIIPFILLACTLKGYAQRDSAAIKDSLWYLSVQHWNYEVDTNEMTSEVYHIARVYSKEKVNLTFPYMDVYSCIYVRNMGGENSVWFAISKGLIGDLGDESLNVLMRFDNEQPKQYTFNFVKEHKKTLIYLSTDATNEVIDKLKKGKKLKMEMCFWHRVTQIVEFNIAGLKWDYKVKVVKEKEEQPVKQGWQYTSGTDRMTSQVSYAATLNAEQKLYFQYPYNGGSIADFGVGNIEGINQVLLHVKPSHIMRRFNGMQVRIRFDSNPPEYYPVLIPDNTEDDYVQILHESELLEKLKKAKKMLVEVEFFNEGFKIIEFNVEGLKWDHKGNPDFEDKEMQLYNNSGVSIKTSVSSTVINNAPDNMSVDSLMSSMNAGNSETTNSTSTEISVNGAVVDTKEIIDSDNGIVKIHCIYKNTTGQKNTITVKAYFMDDKGNVLATKSATLSCSGNAQTGTELSATGILDKYKSYRIEIE